MATITDLALGPEDTLLVQFALKRNPAIAQSMIDLISEYANAPDDFIVGTCYSILRECALYDIPNAYAQSLIGWVALVRPAR